MPQNLRLRILPQQASEQLLEAVPLLGSVVILRTEGSVVEATHEANANTVVIVALHMRADLVVRSALLDTAIAADHVLVANRIPALRKVPLRDLACANVLNSARRGAMEDKPVCALTGHCLAVRRKEDAEEALTLVAIRSAIRRHQADMRATVF